MGDILMAKRQGMLEMWYATTQKGWKGGVS